MITFEELVFKDNRWLDGQQALVKFKNGYGASVIVGGSAFSRPGHPYELAVLHNGKLCYTTELTSDVLGYLSGNEVTAYLQQIEGLDDND